MNISLIVTSDDRQYELERFFDSVEANKREDLEVIFVDQNPYGKNVPIVERYKGNIHIKHIQVGRIISLSKARNIGLEYVEGMIVGFPDDDCWYPEGFFDNLCNALNKPSINFICCAVYDPIENVNYSNKFSIEDIVKMDKKNVYRYTTSVGIFYNLNNTKHQCFDERLGVGAQWFGGEDLDYVLNFLKKKQKGVFVNNLKVYHEIEKGDYNYDKVYKYSIGFGAILKKSLIKYNNINGFLIFVEKIIKIAIKVIFYKLSGNKYEMDNVVSILKGLWHGFTSYTGKER